MAADRDFIDAIQALPAWSGPVLNSYAPQSPETKPTALPFTVVERTDTEWLPSFCGTQGDRCFATVQVTFVARQLVDARRMADRARPPLLAEADSLDSESSNYDADLRAHFVQQSYRVFDVSPNA
jgi:hypothetical protein